MVTNRLKEFFTSRKENDIYKWSNYFEIYERHFSKYTDRPIRFLEIGVLNGGSLKMWKEYFHEGSTIVGVDINPECKQYENPEQNCFVEIGDQSDVAFLKGLSEKYGSFDIILDDGSHMFKHQIASLENLWNVLETNGLYMVEDVHTSYYQTYLGGIGYDWTFIEYVKRLIDELYLYHRNDNKTAICTFSKTLVGIFFYTGIVVLQKGCNDESMSILSGNVMQFKTASALAKENYGESFIKKASFLRVGFWLVKMIYFFLSGNKELRNQYYRQLKIKFRI